MGVSLITGYYMLEVGSVGFFKSFFDTIDYRLTRGLFGKRYPIVLGEFYDGKISFENLDRAELELRDIKKRLKKFKPSKVVWDKSDLSKSPPWGDAISSEISDLSNYFVTSNGKDLFYVVFKAIALAREQKKDIMIE